MFRARKKIKRYSKAALMAHVRKDVRKAAVSAVAVRRVVGREGLRVRVDGSKGPVSNRTGRVRDKAGSAGHRVRMDSRKEDMEIASRVTHHAGRDNMEIKGRASMGSRIKGRVNTVSVLAAVVRVMLHEGHVRLDKIANGVVEAVREDLMVKARANHANTVKAEDKVVLMARVVDKAALTDKDKAADMDRTARSAHVHKASDRIITEAARPIASREIAMGRLHKARANMAVGLAVSRTCIPRTFVRSNAVIAAATNHSSRVPVVSITHQRRAVPAVRRTIPSGTGRLNYESLACVHRVSTRGTFFLHRVKNPMYTLDGLGTHKLPHPAGTFGRAGSFSFFKPATSCRKLADFLESSSPCTKNWANVTIAHTFMHGLLNTRRASVSIPWNSLLVSFRASSNGLWKRGQNFTRKN